jgi:hypothetical protein
MIAREKTLAEGTEMALTLKVKTDAEFEKYGESYPAPHRGEKGTVVDYFDVPVLQFKSGEREQYPLSSLEVISPGVVIGKIDEFGLFVEDAAGSVLIRDDIGNKRCVKHNCELSLCKERH